jgi:site-specific DNA recombinase
MTCDRLEKYDVYLESYTEAFDSQTTVGRMIRGILGVIAQWEREVISENVKSAAHERARQGKRTCSYALGYDAVIDGEFTINEKEAEIIRYIYSAYIKHKCTIAVSDLCRAKGWRGKRGGQFRPYTVYKILTSPLYCGYYSWHGSPIAKGGYDPIMDVKTFNRVQRIILERGKVAGRNPKRTITLIKEEDYRPTD